MTMMVAQYLPKMVECRAAFSSSGSMYLHDMFSASFSDQILDFCRKKADSA